MAQKQAVSIRSSLYPYLAVGMCFCVVLLVNGMSNAGLTVLDEILLGEFGWALGEFKVRDSINFIGAASLIVFVGHAVDKFGFKPPLMIGLLMVAVVYLLYGSIKSLHHLYALHVGLAVALACAGNTVAIIAAASSMPERKGLAIGLTISGTSIGGIVMPWLMTSLSGQFGWRRAMQIEALLPVLLLILIALFLTNAINTQQANTQGKTNNSGIRFKQALRMPRFYVLGVAAALTFFTVLAVFSHLFLYSRSLGFEVNTAVLSISVFSFSALIGKLLFGWLADRMNASQLLKLNMVVMFIGVAGLFKLPQLFWLCLVTAGLGWGGLHTLFNKVVIDLFGMRELGKIMAGMSIFQAGGAGLGAAVTGRLFDLRGDYSLAFNVTLSLMAFAVLLIVFLKPPEYKDQ